MPTLMDLLRQVLRLKVDPDDVKVPGGTYDRLVEQAEDTIQENPEELE